MVVPHGFYLHDTGLRKFWFVLTVGGRLGPVHRCVEGFPWVALSACGSGGLEDSLSALRGVLSVYFRSVGLDCHEAPLFPVEYPPFSLRFDDVDGESFGGCVQGVPRCDGYVHS